MLSAGGAGGDGEVCVSFAVVAFEEFVFGSEPESGSVGLGGERDDSAADSADEGVDDGSEEWSIAVARSGAEGEPCEDFFFGDGSSE